MGDSGVNLKLLGLGGVYFIGLVCLRVGMPFMGRAGGFFGLWVSAGNVWSWDSDDLSSIYRRADGFQHFNKSPYRPGTSYLAWWQAFPRFAIGLEIFLFLGRAL